MIFNQLVKYCAVLIVLTVCVANGAAAEDLNSLVTKIINAYGGESVLNSTSIFRQEGNLSSSNRGQGQVLRLFQWPDQLRVEIHFANEKPELRILNGAIGFQNGAPVKGPMYDSMLLQAARFTLPLSLLKNRSKLQDLGSAKQGTLAIRKLKLQLGEKSTLEVDVDPATGRIVGSVGASDGEMGHLEFATAYEDFRKVDGRLFAFKETNLAGGQKVAETDLTKIEILKTAPAGSFLP